MTRAQIAILQATVFGDVCMGTSGDQDATVELGEPYLRASPGKALDGVVWIPYLADDGPIFHLSTRHQGPSTP